MSHACRPNVARNCPLDLKGSAGRGYAVDRSGGGAWTERNIFQKLTTYKDIGLPQRNNKGAH
jgi:hypothetical protein